MNLRNRMAKLEQGNRGDRCPDCPVHTVLLTGWPSEPDPEPPACPRYGREAPRVVIVEEVVESREKAAP